jgi:fatty-acyl-CoA synthase
MIKDWSQKWSVYRPDHLAVKEDGSQRALTYRELNLYAERLASYLFHHYQIRRGMRIAVLAETCIEYVVLFSAAQKLGFVLVPLNYRYTGRELSYLLQDSQADFILFAEAYRQQLDGLPELESKRNLDINELEGIWSQKQPAFSPMDIEDEDPIFILYTSGTTGFPKGAIYTHKMLFWNSINTAMSLIVNTESRTINCMPPFHTGGWNVLLTPFLHHGAYTVLMKKFDPERVLELLQEEKVTIFMGVPTMLQMISQLPAFESAAFPDLLYLIVGGEAMPIPLIERWDEKEVAVRQGYGMTEVGPNITSLHQDDAIRKKGSIGRANFYVETKIVDEEGHECPPNVPGEFLLKGPMCFPAYWNNEKATQESFLDGWFRTGDRVVQDEEGYIYVVDRIKNMFISGGENVYPAEVEHYILTHPKVETVAVVGVPDPQWGEVGHAYLVTSDSSSSEEMRAYCLKGLAKFKIPKYWTFMDDLPKNDTGKIDRQKLKQSHKH